MSTNEYNFRVMHPNVYFDFTNLEKICDNDSITFAIKNSMDIKPLSGIVTNLKINDTKIWYIDKNINKDHYPFQVYINKLKTGFAITHDLINNDSKFIVLNVICTSKENRYKGGIGRILMTQIIDYAKENNYTGILIHNPTISALPFYEKYGFIKDTESTVIKYPYYNYIQFFPFTKFYERSIHQLGGKIKIMGRLRNIIMNGRTKYVTYKGELRKLSELQKTEKLEKSSK
jgi:ribosomal protein S18 acetylase RimI-like enzyme